MIKTISRTENVFKWLLFVTITAMIQSCGGGQQEPSQMPPANVDFFKVTATAINVEKKYPGMIEGSVNVDIKAQVTGYLEEIYVKEGDYVSKGQSLFRIKGDVYQEQVNNSQAALKSALAAQANAKIELEKIRPLVEGKVVSDMQLKTAQASYDAATAQVAQAKAALGSSQINAAFTVIKAPVSGYIGRIPNRIGNLVTPADATPLTTLSEISNVFVYFSMSEADYLSFMKERKTDANSNTVSLIMADGSVYDHKGRLETASGNIDRSTGSIALKAIFANPDRLLRSGGSARIILNKAFSSVLTVPMASVKDIQNRHFVFTLADSNKVAMKPLEIEGSSGVSYLVKAGLQEGDKVALNNIDVLSEGMPVVPAVIAADSLRSN
ncbi:efflux RND transporter periplasmic adaptor subunit [Chitinophaga tropicalis]|uniref:Efflux RND transporter periplasmic adaptor subunit n=1 Tax=Chitinophaga tropicalis TaxID=2683588 RepID=A0A7K1UE02_9BACT|nr:efflux RND transporter periplasmic adaptor subunit [Chitinophaga tropicalis]MVT12546.1 efflux RND transporter periplasmic adaptor subunit [Chitinophaga tropicalis]